MISLSQTHNIISWFLLNALTTIYDMHKHGLEYNNLSTRQASLFCHWFVNACMYIFILTLFPTIRYFKIINFVPVNNYMLRYAVVDTRQVYWTDQRSSTIKEQRMPIINLCQIYIILAKSNHEY